MHLTPPPAFLRAAISQSAGPVPGSFLAGTVGFNWAGTIIAVGTLAGSYECLFQFEKLDEQSKKNSAELL